MLRLCKLLYAMPDVLRGPDGLERLHNTTVRVHVDLCMDVCTIHAYTDVYMMQVTN
jgi:hypothetical protein